VTSSQPVVTPNALNFTPDNQNCYAYSGVVQVASTNVMQLDFKTNQETIVGHLSVYGSVDDSNSALGSSTAFTVSFNGVIMFKIKCDTESEDMPSVQTVPVLIPPYTEVTVEADNNNADAGLRTAASLTGRVYGMTETEYQ